MNDVRRALSDPPLPPDFLGDLSDAVPETNVDRAAVITSLVAAHARLIEARRALLVINVPNYDDSVKQCDFAIAALASRIATIASAWEGSPK